MSSFFDWVLLKIWHTDAVSTVSKIFHMLENAAGGLTKKLCAITLPVAFQNTFHKI